MMDEPRDLTAVTVGDAVSLAVSAILIQDAEKSGHGQRRIAPNVTPERARELRSMAYDEFVKTDEWQRTASTARSIASNRCEMCESTRPPLDVHHLTYERRGQELADDLIALCRRCHYAFPHRGRR